LKIFGIAFSRRSKATMAKSACSIFLKKQKGHGYPRPFQE